MTPDMENPYTAAFPRKQIEHRIKQGKMRLDAAGLEKQCTRCKEWWPADSAFFFVILQNLGRKSRTVIHAWCRACHYEARQEREQRRKSDGTPAR